MAAKFAVSLMALLGAVSAQTGYTNSSSIATSTTSSASSTFSNGAMVTNAGVVYTIMDDTTLVLPEICCQSLDLTSI